jgi:hypothetical protein
MEQLVFEDARVIFYQGDFAPFSFRSVLGNPYTIMGGLGNIFASSEVAIEPGYYTLLKAQTAALVYDIVKPAQTKAL